MCLIGVAPTSTMPADVRLGRRNDYLDSLEAAGVRVRVLDPDRDDPEEVCRAVDGLLLPGGHDVDPAIYGEPPHATYEAAPVGRDAFELALARLAVHADVPLLAICRGLQVLNVALGGSLVQDIPSHVASTVSHGGPVTPARPKDHLAHTIVLSPTSRLAEIVRADGGICEVNSRHHQAIQAIGGGLLVSAVAPDGVVEAVEVPGLRFCLGVQWHPENFSRTRRFQTLFDAFATAARP